MNRELTPNLAAGASTYSQNWSWPDSPTAILVIHGIGQQDPFDTLDQFASTLIPVMEDEGGGLTISKRHKLLGRDKWNENYISLVSDERPPIDIYEYYWAHETQREITGSEVFQWLVQIGLLAREYYEKNLTLAEKYEKAGSEAFGKQFLFGGRRVFKKYWYLKYAGLLLRLTQGALALADPVLGHFLPGAIKPLKIVGGVVGRFIGDKVANSFGDVVLYTTTDLKSRRYEVRRRILQGCVDKVRQLLLQTQPVQYGRIILVGHSLGSVIAYDTINRINHEMNVAGGVIGQGMACRLKGLVTFGSPLDKIAFFLRFRAGETKHIKRQIQANFHSFRAKNWNPGYNPPPDLALVSDIQHHLDDMVWLNFWDPKDPIGAPLDFYWVDYALDAGRKVDPWLLTSQSLPVFQGNRELDTGEKTPWGAHTGYWENREMFRQILREVVI